MKNSLLTMVIAFLLALGLSPVSVFSAEIEPVTETVAEAGTEVFVQEEEALAEVTVEAVSPDTTAVTPEETTPADEMSVEEPPVSEPASESEEILRETEVQFATPQASAQASITFPGIIEDIIDVITEEPTEPDKPEEPPVTEEPDKPEKPEPEDPDRPDEPEPEAPEKVLQGLHVEGGILSPAFTAGERDYIVTVPLGTGEVYVSMSADPAWQIILDESQWKWVTRTSGDEMSNGVSGAVDIESGMAQLHVCVADGAEDLEPAIYNILIETEPASDPIAYAVEIYTDGMGTAYADCETAEAGTLVTLFVEAEAGSHFAGFEILAGDVFIVDNNFLMPQHDVTLLAIFEEDVPPVVDPTDEPITIGTRITVIWMDVDGTPLDQKTYRFGDPEPTTDKIPVMPEDDENTYEFSMWGDASWEGHTVTYYPFWVVQPKYDDGEEEEPEPGDGGIVGGDAEEPSIGDGDSYEPEMPNDTKGDGHENIVTKIVKRAVATVVSQAGRVVTAAVTSGNADGGNVAADTDIDTDTATETERDTRHAARGDAQASATDTSENTDGNGVFSNGLIAPFASGISNGGGSSNASGSVTPAAQEAVAILEEKESARILMMLLLFAFSVGLISLYMNKRSAPH